MWFGTWDNLHTPTTRWLAYCGLHIFGMRIRGGASTMELFPCSGSHEHPVHFPDDFDLSKVFFRGWNKAFPSSSLPSITMIWKCKGLIMPNFFLEIAHIPCFKILLINPVLTSKLVRENSIANIEWDAFKTTLMKGNVHPQKNTFESKYIYTKNFLKIR